MESLRIKCPSCGIILEVRNSRHETIKKITCPNCKKQLAVNFADVPASKPKADPQPIGAIYEGNERYPLHEGTNPVPHVTDGIAEISVVRLADGSCKHILRVLSTEGLAKVNGQTLLQDDEQVLSRGDELQVGDVVLSFDKPSPKIAIPHIPEPAPEPSPSKRSRAWLPVLAGLAVVICLVVWYFRDEKPSERQMSRTQDSVLVHQDTVRPERPEPRQGNTIAAPSHRKKEAKPNHQSPHGGDDNFSLELRASKGNVSAQYQLGMCWVTSNDCSEVIKGVRYLEAAARSGSAQAQYALGIIYHKGSPACGIQRNEGLSRQYMLQAAQNGNAKARRFLDNE